YICQSFKGKTQSLVTKKTDISYVRSSRNSNLMNMLQMTFGQISSSLVLYQMMFEHNSSSLSLHCQMMVGQNSSSLVLHQMMFEHSSSSLNLYCQKTFGQIGSSLVLQSLMTFDQFSSNLVSQMLQWRLLKITLQAPFLNVQMMSDHNSSDLAPQRQEMSVENVSSGLVPQEKKASDYDIFGPVPPRQNVVPLVEKTDSSQQGLEFLFSPLLEEYYNPTHD
ncbi:hypothetical protein Tco_0290369, partial [Tanacetum coccineum]